MIQWKAQESGRSDNIDWYTQERNVGSLKWDKKGFVNICQERRYVEECGKLEEMSKKAFFIVYSWNKWFILGKKRMHLYQRKHCEKIKFKGSHVNKIKDINTKMKQIRFKRWYLKNKPNFDIFIRLREDVRK